MIIVSQPSARIQDHSKSLASQTIVPVFKHRDAQVITMKWKILASVARTQDGLCNLLAHLPHARVHTKTDGRFLHAWDRSPHRFALALAISFTNNFRMVIWKNTRGMLELLSDLTVVREEINQCLLDFEYLEIDNPITVTIKNESLSVYFYAFP